MRRRDLIKWIATSAAAALPLAARAQQPAMPVIGFLHSASPGPFAQFVAAFSRGLNQAGFTEGRNVAIEYRWAEGQYDRLPSLAADLVRRQVAVIVAMGGPSSGLAAKAATSTIPIVFNSGGDPVKEGLAASLDRPGGNATGVVVLLTAMEGKRLGLLREMVPTATLIAVLLNHDMPTFETQLNDVQEAARAVGQQIHISCTQAANTRSMPPSRRRLNCEPEPCWSPPIRLNSTSAIGWSRSRRATPFRRSTNCAGMRRSAA